MNISDLTPDQIDRIFLLKLTELVQATAAQRKSICYFDYDPAALLGLSLSSKNPSAGKITVAIAGGASCDLLKKAVDLASIKH